MLSSPLLLCLSCGYSLAGVACSGEADIDAWRCPECGAHTQRQELHALSRLLHAVRPPLWPAAVTFFLAALAAPTVFGLWNATGSSSGLSAWLLIFWVPAEMLLTGIRAAVRLPHVLRWRALLATLESATQHAAAILVGVSLGVLARLAMR